MADNFTLKVLLEAACASRRIDKKFPILACIGTHHSHGWIEGKLLY